ncbi:MAG: ribosomal protein L7/L12 [Candidatus Babeliaceae bacterium]|jgi:ribosomal protein L7/L12
MTILILLLLFCTFLITTLLGEFFLTKEKNKNEHIQKLYSDAQEKCVIKLVSVGPDKIKIIKALRECTDWDITITKNKVEAPLPAVLIVDMPIALAEELRTKLEKLATIIEIHKY